MAKRSCIGLQKKIVALLSDGEVWTNRQIFLRLKDVRYGFDSYRQCHSILGQMSRSTNKRISATHEIVKVGEGRFYQQSDKGLNFGTEHRYIEYILQRRMPETGKDLSVNRCEGCYRCDVELIQDGHCQDCSIHDTAQE